jgi:hypothetical protein
MGNIKWKVDSMDLGKGGTVERDARTGPVSRLLLRVKNGNGPPSEIELTLPVLAYVISPKPGTGPVSAVNT